MHLTERARGTLATHPPGQSAQSRPSHTHAHAQSSAGGQAGEGQCQAREGLGGSNPNATARPIYNIQHLCSGWCATAPAEVCLHGPST